MAATSRSSARQRKSSRNRRSSRERPQKADKKQLAEARSEALRSAFLRRIYDPSIVPNLRIHFEKESSDCIESVSGKKAPWILKFGIVSQNGATSHPDKVVAYPSWNYLELRQTQHTHWASQRLEQGVTLAKDGKSSQAEARYKEGLNLAPTHAPLLVAYGALCANLGRTQEAVIKLKEAIRIDPKCTNAQEYLDKIQSRTAKPAVPPRQAASAHRAETAMQDVLMERSFLSGDTVESEPVSGGTDSDYPLIHEETPVLTKDDELDHHEPKTGEDDCSVEDVSRRSRRKRHRRERSRERQGRNHTRRTQKEAESDRPERSLDRSDSEEDHNGRKRRKKRYKRRSRSRDERRHRRRHKRSVSEPDEGGAESTSDHSRRRKHRRKHRKESRRDRGDESRSPSPTEREEEAESRSRRLGRRKHRRKHRRESRRYREEKSRSQSPIERHGEAESTLSHSRGRKHRRKHRKESRRDREDETRSRSPIEHDGEAESTLSHSRGRTHRRKRQRKNDRGDKSRPRSPTARHRPRTNSQADTEEKKPT